MGLVTKEVSERNLAALARSPGGFQFTTTFFPYTSGKIGPYYVQSAGMMSDGNDYHQACADMAGLVEFVNENHPSDKRISVISGGETRDWIFSPVVANILKLPHTMVYKDGKMIGASLKGRYVGHIADLNNEGSSPKELWKPAIEKAGGTLREIFFFVDRMEHGVGVMKELGLERHALVELDANAWDYLQNSGVVNSEVYRNLQRRTENDEKWAREMLQSSEGLETLLMLFASSKNREKAQKILNVGYPDMKVEVQDRIKLHFGSGVGRWFA